MEWLKTAAAVVAGVVVALVTGFVGLAAFFSDLGPSETEAKRIAFVVATYAVGCGLVGALLPRAWYVALIAAWGPLFLAVPELISGPASGLSTWNLAELVLVPAAALVFGYVGARLRGRPSSSSAPTA